MNTCSYGVSRRSFLKQSAAAAGFLMTPSVLTQAMPVKSLVPQPVAPEPLQLTINGKVYDLSIDARTSLLDLLREQIGLTGTKKGCDMGHCGACMVHVNGKRVNSCLSLAIDNQGSQVTTIEGLAVGDQLHPMQQAFIQHDGFQCGYCTSGQIMSAIACIREGHADSREAIRDYMDSNICRCGAYQNIVDAIVAVKQSGVSV